MRIEVRQVYAVSIALIGLLVCTSPNAQTAGQASQVIDLVMSSVKLYSNPELNEPVREVSKSELQFPLEVYDQADSPKALKVKVGGRFFWVAQRYVEIKRSSTAQCIAQSGNTKSTLGTRGAGRACN